MERIEQHISASAKKQWAGMGAPMVRGADGRKHKATVSVANAEMITRTAWAFLRHAYLKEWKPFTLKGLLTPERITDFLYHSSCVDGAGVQLTTVRMREQQLLDFFYRGRNARPNPVVVITAELEKKIRQAMAEEQEHRDEWNLAPANQSNTGKHKWYPELAEVRLAERALLEQIDRAEERHDRGGMSDLKFWQEVRDAVLTLCTMYCMWRVDTAATGSLLHLRRDPVSGAVVDEEGFIVIENIARAKNPAGDWYPFVPELVIPPNAVRLIEKLLKIEGRSLTRPLCPGESALHLTAVNRDRWGNDVLPDGELTVVPIFRQRPGSPEPLKYNAIQEILDRQLQALHFGATNPHTLRATGAIYWTFIREMPEDLVMTLGLWEDAKTLRKHYAHLHQRDRRARMARYMPPASGIVPPKLRGKREEAAASALASLGKMLEKTTNPYEARVLLAELRQQCEKIDQTIAAELGVTWEAFRPDRFEPGEVERIDAALRGVGYARGISGVIGRDLFAREHSPEPTAWNREQPACPSRNSALQGDY